MSPAQTRLIAALRERLEPRAIVTDPADIAPWETDWRGRFHGRAPALIAPASRDELAATVRLANLRSGQLDFIERVAPSDMEKIVSEKKFRTASITEIGYQGITINVGKSDKAKANPLGRDARVREAFELALDRQGLVQVVMDNEAIVGNQWVAPNNPFYAKNVPIPKRDVARASRRRRAARPSSAADVEPAAQPVKCRLRMTAMHPVSMRPIATSSAPSRHAPAALVMPPLSSQE